MQVNHAVYKKNQRMDKWIHKKQVNELKKRIKSGQGDKITKKVKNESLGKRRNNYKRIN